MIKALRALSFHTLYNMQPFGVIACVSRITKVLSYKLWYCYFSTPVVKRTTLFEMLGILCDSFVFEIKFSMLGMRPLLPHYYTRAIAFQFTMLGTQNNCIAL